MIRLTGSTSRTCCVDCLSAKHNSALLGWGRRRPWSIWSVARGFCGWAKPATEAELSIRRVCKRWLSPIVWWPNALMKPMLSRSNCYWDKSGHGRWNTDFIMAGYDKEIGFAKFCLSDRYIYLNMSYYIYSYWICFNHTAFYIKSPINYITERHWHCRRLTDWLHINPRLQLSIAHSIDLLLWIIHCEMWMKFSRAFGIRLILLFAHAMHTKGLLERFDYLFVCCWQNFLYPQFGSLNATPNRSPRGELLVASFLLVDWDDSRRCDCFLSSLDPQTILFRRKYSCSPPIITPPTIIPPSCIILPSPISSSYPIIPPFPPPDTPRSRSLVFLVFFILLLLQ